MSQVEVSHIHINCSTLTHTIWAGKVSAGGNSYLDKKDITADAIVAVAQHLHQTGHVHESHAGNLVFLPKEGKKKVVELTEQEKSAFVVAFKVAIDHENQHGHAQDWVDGLKSIGQKLGIISKTSEGADDSE